MQTKTFIDNDGRENNFAIEPKMYTTEGPQAGWTEYAELLNGRMAMIGFVALLIQEVLTGHGIVGFISSL
ncbi:MAG: high light inducible protein [Chamaesiphon sp.]|nr:high light inducible protein [Chamaesiphon sp.]